VLDKTEIMISQVAYVRWAFVTIPFHRRTLASPFGFPETLFSADERAKLAVLEVLRSLNCCLYFVFVFRSDTQHENNVNCSGHVIASSLHLSLSSH